VEKNVFKYSSHVLLLENVGGCIHIFNPNSSNSKYNQMA
jgi:hypothetical protein